MPDLITHRVLGSGVALGAWVMRPYPRLGPLKSRLAGQSPGPASHVDPCPFILFRVVYSTALHAAQLQMPSVRVETRLIFSRLAHPSGTPTATEHGAPVMSGTSNIVSSPSNVASNPPNTQGSASGAPSEEMDGEKPKTWPRIWDGTRQCTES